MIFKKKFNFNEILKIRFFFNSEVQLFLLQILRKSEKRNVLRISCSNQG